METTSTGNGLPSKKIISWAGPGFSNGLDRPRLDYSHRPVQGILDVPPFAQSAQSYGIAPQPTSSNVTYQAGNLFPPPSCPDPFASDTFSYCPPTSSVDLPLYQSTIHDSTFQCHLTPTTTLDPELSVLKPHNEMDAQDKVVRQAEAPRPTKIKRPRNRGTDSDEDYRPSPPKRRRELAPRLPSSSLATRSPGAVKSSSTSKRNSPNPRPRRSRTTRLAVTHPSGYHLGESASSNIHEWLRVYFTPSKAQRSLRICAFCGVSDGNLSRHVLSTLNHCVDWMLGILEETLCGSLLLDALNFVVIWAETTHGPVSVRWSRRTRSTA
ncbi:hypothetical protein BS47DRAFT_1485949 [Hydnum rufescens UP504]|uniref:Uncharacterized protein n=1 Tax=Hydnum rufescens UP504 TaxID=1448309 RepID=A0A9P6AVP8_9AGAM|nr:hypothetical protein BS47DRAFT_1485949 [Hydnum rufescens UP504]